MQGSTHRAQYIAAYDPLGGDGTDCELLFDFRDALNTCFHFRKFAYSELYMTPQFKTPRLLWGQPCSSAAEPELEMKAAMSSLISTFLMKITWSLCIG